MSGAEPSGFWAWLSKLPERRRSVITIGVAAMLLGLASALTLRPGTAVRDMLPEQGEAAAALDRALTQFRLIDDLMILAEVPPDGGAGQAELLQFAESLREALQGDSEVASVRFTHEQISSAFVSDVLLPDLWARLTGDQREALEARLEPSAMRDALARHAATLAAPGTRPPEWFNAVRTDPLGLVNALGNGESGLDHLALPRVGDEQDPEPAFSEDGNALLIRVAGTRPANDLAYTQRFVARIRAQAEALAPPGVSLRFTGPYAIADFSASSTKRDMIVSLLVSLGLLSALFLVVYRDLRTLPMVLATVNGGLLVAFGLYAAAGGSLTPVTAVCGAVLAGLGIDYGIHLITHARSRSAEALARAVREVGPVLLAACVTSALGFAVVAAAGVRALTEFAMLGVLGLFATLAMTLLFLPAVLQRAAVAEHDQPARLRHPLTFRAVERITARPRGWLFGFAIVLGMALGVVTTQRDGGLRFADDLEAMHATPNPPLETQAEITARFGVRPSAMLVHVTANNLDALLERCAAIESALRDAKVDEPRIATVLSPAAWLTNPKDAEVSRPETESVLSNFDAAVEASPFSAAAFSGFRSALQAVLTPSKAADWDTLRAYEAVTGPVLPRSFFMDGATPTEALVVVTLSEPWELMEDRAALLSALRSAAATTDGATLTGLAVVGAEMQAALASVVNRLIVLAAVAVVVWLAIFFRNPWEVLAALAPAGAGLLVLAAALLMTGTELHAANLIALPLTLGLGVDDGIILVAVARRVRRARGTVAELRGGLALASSAIVMTSLTTLIAFGSLAFTGTPAVRSLGALSAVGVTTCLTASLLGLVPALMIAHRRRSWRPSRPRG